MLASPIAKPFPQFTPIFHCNWFPKNNLNQHCSTRPSPTTTSLTVCWLGTLSTEWVIACMETAQTNCITVRKQREEWWLTALHGKRKQPANDFVMSRCSSNPTLSLIQWRKPTKVKTVHKVRNKDLVLPLMLGWHFWDRTGKRRTLPAVSIKRQGTEVVDLLWSYVPCGRLE